MKTILILTGLTLSTSLLAARESKVLLMAPANARTSAATRAIVDDVKISADAITYDAAAKAVRCEGAVTLQTSAGVVKTTACTIELSNSPTVYVLNPHGITVQPGAARENVTPAAGMSGTAQRSH